VSTRKFVLFLSLIVGIGVFLGQIGEIGVVRALGLGFCLFGSMLIVGVFGLWFVDHVPTIRGGGNGGSGS
jgi:hypothetical protein